MTKAELIGWGTVEDKRRKADLAAVHAGTMDFHDVQTSAKERRLAAGLSMGDAMHAIGLAQRMHT